MALYKYAQNLHQNNHANFDASRAPGNQAPDAGIYRCEVCGHEIGIAKDHVLPAQNHHMHQMGQGPIRWKLLVAAVN
jgi:hypothetical protein